MNQKTNEPIYDVIIIGSGFGGAVTATMLAKSGHKVAMIEKGKHPRFALGESTTPIFGKVIQILGETYDIPEFISMSSYDRIISDNLPFTSAPKELFHYFWHEQGLAEPRLKSGEVPEIIVQTPGVDSQLLRAESDVYLIDVARKYGAEYFDETSIETLDFRDNGVSLHCVNNNEECIFEAQFIIDASGYKSVLSKHFGLAIPQEDLDVPLKTRSIFTHFNNIGELEDAMPCDKAFLDRAPVSRHRSTQHHCFEGGWLWLIRFDNGIASVGLSLDLDKFPINDKSGEEEFWEIINRYPIMKNMLEGRERLMPYIKTGRTQFRTTHAVGDRWALLSGAAVGGDAWFATGLGHTLICINRLVDILNTKILANKSFDKKYLAQYEKSLYKEWHHFCYLVDGIYKSFKHFDVFRHYAFFCFMGAETFVMRGGIGRPHDPKWLQLNVGDDHFLNMFNEIYNKVLELYKLDNVPTEDVAYLHDFICNRMKDYNMRDYGNIKHERVHPRISPATAKSKPEFA